MNVVKKIYTNGRIEDVVEKMKLKQMQEFVGGYIEMVPSNIAHRALIVNEEGTLIGLPTNREATKLVNPRTLMGPNGIQGNALLIKN